MRPGRRLRASVLPRVVSGRSFESWEGRINKATRALERMERVAASMRMPAMPSAPSGGYGRGSASRGGGAVTEARVSKLPRAIWSRVP